MGQIRPYEEDGELACTIQIKNCHEENRAEKAMDNEKAKKEMNR
jgi:hypothetical protein